MVIDSPTNCQQVETVAGLTCEDSASTAFFGAPGCGWMEHPRSDPQRLYSRSSAAVTDVTDGD
jgi:hypothetical protein